MKRVLSLVVSVVLLAMLAFSFGCSGSVRATDENSYMVSIYKEVREQTEKGEIVVKGLELVKSDRVIRSQFYELPSDEKYLFNESVYKEVGEKKYILPTSDRTIAVIEREKKNIRFILGSTGIDICEGLSENEKSDFIEKFSDTYEETFRFDKEWLLVLKKAYGVGKVINKVELYTKASFNATDGEPFASVNIQNNNAYGACELITSTDVYVVIK